MNNEPVAWINTDFDSVSTTPNIRSWLSYKKEGTASQPLYTHPHSDKSVKEKTLTDEDGVVNESAEFTIEQWNLLKKAREG